MTVKRINADIESAQENKSPLAAYVEKGLYPFFKAKDSTKLGQVLSLPEDEKMDDLLPSTELSWRNTFNNTYSRHAV